MTQNEESLDKLAIQIGNKVREIRNARNMTQEELGHRAGVLTIQVNNTELGKKSPNIKTLYKLAEGLNVPLTEIVDIDRRFVEEITTPLILQEIEQILHTLKIEDQNEILNIVRSVAKIIHAHRCDAGAQKSN